MLIHRSVWVIGKSVSATALFLGVVAVAGGCTQANPNYVTVFDQALGDAAISGDSPVADLRGGGEVLPPPQDGRIVDLPKVDHTLPVDVALPPPDLGVCTRPEDCDDGLSCTDDRCALGVCVHDLRAGSCAIDGVCYGVNESDPKNSCQRCAPGSASHVWTVASDGSQCKDDGLWCTVDRCQTGLCAHVQDQGCVVNGTCVKAGTPDVGNECLVCIPSAATVGYTFVDGEICGAKKQGICVKRACRHLVPTVVPTAGKNVVDGSLRAVTYQPTSKEIWAGGTLVRRGAGGSLLAMGILTHLNASSSVKVEVVVDPVRSLSNRLAVQGRVFSHYDISTGNWTKEAGLQTALGRITREGVWGTSLGQDEIYYLTGHVTAQKRGVVRCKRAASGMWTCVDHGGFVDSTAIGGVVGTMTSASLGRLWAVSYAGYEHIYANDGISTQWSRQAPRGCSDTTGNPCSTTFSTDFRDIYAASESNVWVVGLSGMVMHFDGKIWLRYDGVFKYQANYDLDAVYSDDATGLTIIAAHRDLSYGRYVSLYTFNQKLNRWRGPVTVEKRFDKPLNDAILLDIGGAAPDDLWFVGHSPVIDGTRPWALHLQ